MKKKHELEVLKILAEIENPDKIIEDCARQIAWLAKEKSKKDSIHFNEYVEEYLDLIKYKIEKS